MDGTVEAEHAGDERPAGERVAVVTGASRGLGAGMAARFAAAGLGLGLCARHEPAAPAPDDPPPATPTPAGASPAGASRAGTLPAAPSPAGAPAGGRVVTAAVDVTDPAAVDRFCDLVVERLGRIDLWVNNAGLLAPIGPLRDVDPGELRANVDANVLGVLYGSAAFARHVRGRAGGGTLVNITSGAATRPYVGWAAYCASKAAVDHATRVVAEEEADAGLRAFAVAPGVVDTAMQEMIRATPAERFPAVERFREIRAAGAYNSPAWVADHILGLLDAPPDAPVVQRVPAEPGGVGA
jgi:NAD(P)-dependent dehydrogenase (short-subunit alcohol dehydrogenase family)